VIPSEEVVRQEVTDLHRFIEPLVRVCSELRVDYPVFSDSSKEFFRYIETLGGESLRYLERFPEEILKAQDSRLTATKRQKLLNLKSAWERLHSYLRPALSADTLHLPTALISTSHDRLHETEEWRSSLVSG
jgi:hypothetical protein